MNKTGIEYFEEVKGSVYLQMAMDEVLLNTSIKSESKNIIFRIHNIYPYGITLGTNQKLKKNIIEKLTNYKIDFTRRLTGGRAVPHFQEITYSLIAPIRAELSGNVNKSYLLISEGLVKGLNLSGINANIASYKTENNNSFSCFASVGKHEILLNNKKILGSAQYRKKGYILQQGTLIYKKIPDKTKIFFLIFKNTSLEENLEILPDKNKIVENIIIGIKERLNKNIIKKKVNKKMFEEIYKLENEKYRNKRWILHITSCKSQVSRFKQIR